MQTTESYINCWTLLIVRDYAHLRRGYSCTGYTADVLQAAQSLADHAGRSGPSRIEKDDVEMAIQMRRRYEFFEPPPRDVSCQIRLSSSEVSGITRARAQFPTPSHSARDIRPHPFTSSTSAPRRSQFQHCSRRQSRLRVGTRR